MSELDAWFKHKCMVPSETAAAHVRKARAGMPFGGMGASPGPSPGTSFALSPHRERFGMSACPPRARARQTARTRTHASSRRQLHRTRAAHAEE